MFFRLSIQHAADLVFETVGFVVNDPAGEFDSGDGLAVLGGKPFQTIPVRRAEHGGQMIQKQLIGNNFGMRVQIL